MSLRQTVSCLLLLITAAALLPAAGGAQELTGHLKLQYLGASYDEQSLFREVLGSSSSDLNLDLRLNFSLRSEKRPKLDLTAEAQAIGLFGDTIEKTRGSGFLAATDSGRLISDERRLWDLTTVHTDDRSFAGITRFDRLSIGYTGRKTVLRIGRQAITWGNGFLFTPMDIFNPFDPTAVDKEYKSGDDMLYGQYLSDRGDDTQVVVVARRDLLTGKVDDESSSAAIRYHGLAGVGEYDLVVAEHFGETLIALGANRSLGGAVWRGDLVATRTGGGETVTSMVTSLSYSWMLFGKNMNGVAEYFYNGYGQSGGHYSPEELAANPDLLRRVGRGELFNLGRNYLASSVTIEITPLFLLTPNLFVNLEDPSALLQIVSQHDLKENWVFQAALAIPIGGHGTEYGGIPVDGSMGRYLSSDANVFVQLAFYF